MRTGSVTTKPRSSKGNFSTGEAVRARVGGSCRHPVVSGLRDHRLLFFRRPAGQKCRNRALVALKRWRGGASCRVDCRRDQQEGPLRRTPLRQSDRQDCVLEPCGLRRAAGRRARFDTIRKPERRADARNPGCIPAMMRFSHSIALQNNVLHHRIDLLLPAPA